MAVTEEGGRAFPEPTIGERTILGYPALFPWKNQGCPGTEPEPETGTVGTVFPGTERGTGTARTVFQEPKPEPEPSSLLNCIETHKNSPPWRNRRDRKPEPLELTVPSPNRNRTEPNRGHPEKYRRKKSAKFKSEFGSFVGQKSPHCKDLALTTCIQLST